MITFKGKSPCPTSKAGLRKMQIYWSKNKSLLAYLKKNPVEDTTDTHKQVSSVMDDIIKRITERKSTELKVKQRKQTPVTETLKHAK